VADLKITLLAKALHDSVTKVRGTTNLELRRRIFERAASKVLRREGPEMPELEAIVDSVALRPQLADVEALLEQGLSEDAVYEIVVTAAVGAGFAQVEKALSVLEAVKR
jgi:alkylhydroperoxidase/carboxymuconolactone decarboxylase family protein YurZ